MWGFFIYKKYLYLQPKLIKKMEKLTAKELRVGNLVNYHDDGLLFEVTRIDDLGIGIKNNEPETAQETWIEYECFSPIPLTEEWLLKFGFIKNDRQIYLTNGYIWLDFFSLGSVDLVIEGQSIELKIKYVHQLQNLYFALTNEELKLND